MIVITDIKYMLSFFVVKCLKYVVNGKKRLSRAMKPVLHAMGKPQIPVLY